jgi:hypothetical protein
VQICYIFRDTGRCEFGDDCRFSHNLDANGPAAAAPAGGARGGRGPRKENGGNAAGGAKPKRVCRDFAATGNCKFGDECRFSHEAAVGTLLLLILLFISDSFSLGFCSIKLQIKSN